MKRLWDRLRFYFFAAGWLWDHRDWTETRQKYKALDRDWCVTERERTKRIEEKHPTR